MKLGLVLAAAAVVASASDSYPPPRFTDAQRVAKLRGAMPQVDEIFRRFATERGSPGLVWGVVIDGQLAHVSATGISDRESKQTVTPDTAFRIASMTKSFTALAVLRLRDEGKLSLEDPVAKWIPEFSRLPLPTADSAPLQVRQLLTHTAGFPEDNPWGDQQLAVGDETLNSWLRAGIPYSTTPATAYEYSNYGFALLGRIVSKASGIPYREYLEKQILAPLRMEASTLEPDASPKELRAIGYRKLSNGAYQVEPSLAHGSFGAMGGLLTSARDLGRYVAFMLAAWPPRDEAEFGPVRRSSVREMQQLWRLSDLSVTNSVNAPPRASAAGYGYGLRISRDCRFRHIVGHGGGLPGFGSYMMWLPEYGVGMFAMANITYAGPASAISEAFDVLSKTGALRPRELPPSPVLEGTRDALAKLWTNWTDESARELAASNLLLDVPVDERRRGLDQLKAQVGRCGTPEPVQPENWLRGSFRMPCERGGVRVTFTLAPTTPPKVQHLVFAREKDAQPPAACAP